jgi:N-acetylmuramoyl-L-alanine amidase
MCTAMFAVAGVLAVQAQRSPDHMRGAHETGAVRVIEDHAYVGANLLSRLLGATRYWRADVRKLELRTARHRMVLTVDNPFVVVDQQTVYLGSPVRSLEGEVHVPVALVDTLAAWEGWPRLLHDPASGLITRVPSAGLVKGPSVTHASGITRIVFPADAPDRVSVADGSRDRFQLHFEGLFAGSLPVALPEFAWLDTLQLVPAARGSAVEMRFDRRVRSYRVTKDAPNSRVVLEVAAGARRFSNRFARQRRAAARDLQVIVLDPGHGGLDVGARVGTVEEKTLCLQLARRLRDEITSRLEVEVVLTRGGDRTLSAEQRAMLANRVHADLVISVHFDGFADGAAQGVTAYYAPATDRRRGARATALREWRGASAVHAADSRQLAESLLASLESGGLGPTRMREILPYPLIGVDAPGILLECAMLTSEQDRARVTTDSGLAALATSIVDGLVTYRENK